MQRNASEALRLYRQAVQTAPYEAYAMAPFLALQWLRLRLLLAPLLRLLAAASGGPGRARAAAVAGRGSSAGSQQWHQRSPGLPAQWDSLLIAAMVGVLTWVLWRKRQLQQRAEPPSTAGAQQRQPAAATVAGPSAAPMSDATVTAAVVGAAASTSREQQQQQRQGAKPAAANPDAAAPGEADSGQQP